MKTRFTKQSAFLFLVILWAILYLPGLGIKELGRNEGRRILPAKTMLKTGNYLVPILGGEAYFKKPPMMNWMIAAAFKLTGIQSAFAARLPTVITVLLFVLVLLFIPGALLSINERVIAGCVFLTTFGMIGSGRTANIDPNYVCFAGFAVITWISLWYEGKTGWKLWLLPAIFISTGILLKGPLILLIFYIPVIVLCCMNRQCKTLLSIPHIVSIAIMFSLFVLWYYLAAKTGLGERAGQTGTGMTGTWYAEIMHRFHYGEVPFSKWLKRVLGGMGQFLPWVPGLLLFAVPNIRDKFDNKTRIFLKAGIISLVISFVLVNAMPLTKARYSLPLLPLMSVILAKLIFAIPLQQYPNVFKKRISAILTTSSILTAILGCMGFLLIKFGLTTTLLQHPTHLKHINLNAYIPLFQGMTVSLVSIILSVSIYRIRSSLNKIEIIMPASSLIIASAVMLFWVIIFPFTKDTYSSKFVSDIHKIVPQNEVLYTTSSAAKEPAMFYLKRKLSLLSQADKIPENASFFLIGKNNKDYLEILKKDFISTNLIKYETNYHKHKYYIIKIRHS